MGVSLIIYPQLSNNSSNKTRFKIYYVEFLFLNLKNSKYSTSKTSPLHISAAPLQVSLPHTQPLKWVTSLSLEPHPGTQNRCQLCWATCTWSEASSSVKWTDTCCGLSSKILYAQRAFSPKDTPSPFQYINKRIS